MDPVANLREQLERAKRLQQQLDLMTEPLSEVLIDALRLAELVLALNKWIDRGGFFPAGRRR